MGVPNWTDWSVQTFLLFIQITTINHGWHLEILLLALYPFVLRPLQVTFAKASPIGRYQPLTLEYEFLSQMLLSFQSWKRTQRPFLQAPDFFFFFRWDSWGSKGQNDLSMIRHRAGVTMQLFWVCGLGQQSATCFCKWSDRKNFRMCWPRGLCRDYSTRRKDGKVATDMP